MSDPQSTEVETWSGAKTFHPEMRLEAAAEAVDVLDALAAALLAEKFTLSARRTGGFSAKHVNWLAVVVGSLDRASLDISAVAAADAPGVVVLVAASSNGDRSAVGKRVARALGAGVADLRRRGVSVAVHPWVVPEDRKKGKRR